MFNREHSISAIDFKKILAIGKRKFTPHFRLMYAPDEILRVAVAVPKKIYSKASMRSVVKRRIRSAMFNITNSSHRTGSYIVFVTCDIDTLSFSEIEQELADVLQKITV